jgi:hypothetical protein
MAFGRWAAAAPWSRGGSCLFGGRSGQRVPKRHVFLGAPGGVTQGASADGKWRAVGHWRASLWRRIVTGTSTQGGGIDACECKSQPPQSRAGEQSAPVAARPTTELVLYYDPSCVHRHESGAVNACSQLAPLSLVIAGKLMPTLGRSGR